MSDTICRVMSPSQFRALLRHEAIHHEIESRFRTREPYMFYGTLPSPMGGTVKYQDVRTETYRSHGAATWCSVRGTGVRLTHIPTGLISQFDEHWSAHVNKVIAWNELTMMVKARLNAQAPTSHPIERPAPASTPKVPEKTTWFPGTVAPVRPGVYEFPGGTFAKYDVEGWYFNHWSVEGAAKERWPPTNDLASRSAGYFQWRGFTTPQT